MTRVKQQQGQKAENGPFDRALVKRRRERAQKLSGDRFLFERCVDDVVERVLDVRRQFQNTLLIGDQNITQTVTKRLGDKIGHTTSVNDVVCDEETLPYKPESFDLVINLLTLQAVNKVPQALVKTRNLLKPDGLFLAAFFGGETLSVLRHVMYVAEDKLYGRVSPRVSSMITLDLATKLLSSSGFTMPVADRDMVNVSYNELGRLYADLRLMGENNVLTARSKMPVSRRFFREVEAIYKRDHSTEVGKFAVTFEIIWLTGWAPHPDQPKPLKPGSAKIKLADALGVGEEKL
jgi:SAM-dependent methyltransferase